MGTSPNARRRQSGRGRAVPEPVRGSGRRDRSVVGLAEVAHDLDVSTATAGQLRTVAGLVAGLTALALGRFGSRVGLGRQLLAGAVLLALGSLASAAAPGIELLAVAQAPVGAGIAVHDCGNARRRWSGCRPNIEPARSRGR